MAQLRIPYRLLTTELDLQSELPVSSFVASTIRGGFGYTLKRIVCIQRNIECGACLMKNNCIYPFLLETPPPPDATRLKKYRNIPRPFAFRPCQDGTVIKMKLLLIGKAVEMVPFFIYTLNELGKKGLGKKNTTFTIVKVWDEGNETVYHAMKPDECGNVTPMMLEVIQGNPLYGSLTLTFKSPLVIRKNGAVLHSFEAFPFFTTLLRRITNLNAFYGIDPHCSINPQQWLSAAKSIVCETATEPFQQKRFSTRQNKKIDYTGITGTVKLTGDIGTLMPLIQAGEVLGVGKNTVFGQGEYEVGGQN